uniref:C-type lectin domain-containing protein n=1 Tax=Amphiprion percula TaxID=161767 RepID=A0A3P8UHC6_AMPPE
MFEHKVAHKRTWYQSTLGQRLMIDVIVVSSDLRPNVLDTQVKRGAELSTDHHLVVSWIRCTPMNWTNAQRYCRERYTDLASMRSESERNKMKMLVKTSAWIGLYRVAWKWSDGQIMDMTSFQKWSTGQPKKIKHYCVTTTHGGWNARPCSDKYAFVCRGE